MPIRYGEIVSHDRRHAIVNYAADVGADTLLIERSTGSNHLLGSDAGWIEDHAPCDVIEVSNFDHETVKHIGVITDEGPFDPAKVGLADALATAVDGTLTFYFAVAPDAPASRRNTIEDYFSELVDLCEAPIETRIIESETEDTIELVARDSDVHIVSGIQRGLTDRLFGYSPASAENEHGTLVVYGERQPGRIRTAVERYLF
jgi:hypothetical protein